MKGLDGLRSGETNDCTVKALVTLSGNDYPIVHAIFKAHGRKDRKGFAWHKKIHAIGEAVGLRLRHVRRSGSLGKLIRLYPTAKLAVEVSSGSRRHAVAVINGKIMDWTKPGQHVKRAWVVEV